MIFILVLITTTLFSSHDISPIGNFLDFKTIDSWIASSNNSFMTFDHSRLEELFDKYVRGTIAAE